MKNRGLSLAVCLCAVACAAWSQQYTITTIAGNGQAGFAGDSGAPSTAQFSSPSGLAFDSKGNLYIADSANHRIRMISGGTITTVAGNGTAGYAGEAAAAASANLNTPTGIAFDASGNLYIADSVNNVIRKVTGTTITTIAGIQNQGPGYGGDTGLANVANLNNPTGIVFDSAGNYYIADNGNSLIRIVNSSGVINSYLGSGATQGRLDHPTAMIFGLNNALFVSDTNDNRIAKYIAPTLSNFAGNLTAGSSGDGNLATLAQLNKPVGIAVDAAGNVYIADTNNSRIRKVSTDGTIATIAGKGIGYSGDGGPATSATLNFPRGIAVAPNGNIYVADTGNNAIRLLTPSFPTISSGGVVNAASFAARISPGALATVFGGGFGSATVQPDLPLPTTAANVSVTVNDKAAPIFYLSPTQINFQVPWSTPTSGSVNVAVTYLGGASNTLSVPVATAAPGLFSRSDLPGAAVVQNSDYSLNDPSNPAKAGSTIIAYLTGSGPVSPAVADGAPTPSSPLVNATAAVTATIGSAPATVSFTGLAPFFVGLVQMNIAVPTSLAPGVYPLAITIDGQAANSATIAVK